ncbi:hypothetical protein GCM10023238_16480 [Streptomyces heliomycini]
MVNVLGGDYPDMYSRTCTAWPRPQLKIHMYGKDVKPGRKVGTSTLTATTWTTCWSAPVTQRLPESTITE